MRSLEVKVIGEDHIEEEKDRLYGEQEIVVEDIESQAWPIKWVQGETQIQ